MSNSLSESTITTVRHIESFLRMYDSRVSLEPRVYEVSSINGLFSDKHVYCCRYPHNVVLTVVYTQCTMLHVQARSP